MKKSLLYYKGSKHLSELIALTDCEKSTAADSKFTFRDLLARGFIISVALVILNQFCGVIVVLTYSTKMFEEAGSQLSPIQASACLVALQFIGSTISTNCVEICGRKKLFILSSFGTCIGLICQGMHAIYKDQLQNYRWIPVVILSLVISISALGVLPLPFTICMEILPPKVCIVGRPILFHTINGIIGQ